MIQSRSCPSCLRRVEVSQFKLGDRVRCPYCKSEFQIQPQMRGAPVAKGDADQRHRQTNPRPRLPKTGSMERLQVEGYERFEEVGKGAMGKVYKAYQSKLRRKVALKVLALEHADKSGFVDRFRREAATGARITHRNVVRVYDILTGRSYDREGVSTEVHVISMEFVDGPHLRQLNQSEVRGNLPKALDYFRQICSGVAAAHEQGVVHRDLKPENIMLDRETNVLKVADFGLAYFVDRDERDAVWDTKTRMTMGTVAYMPPEQGRDAKRVVESGDVYSLGRMLYEMITGSLPDGSFSAASTIVRELPESMDRLIEKCLEPKPERRYQSAGELLEAFDACTAEPEGPEDDEPVAEEVPEVHKMSRDPSATRRGGPAGGTCVATAGGPYPLAAAISAVGCGGSAVARRARLRRLALWRQRARVNGRGLAARWSSRAQHCAAYGARRLPRGDRRLVAA